MRQEFGKHYIVASVEALEKGFCSAVHWRVRSTFAATQTLCLVLVHNLAEETFGSIIPVIESHMNTCMHGLIWKIHSSMDRTALQQI